MEDKQLAKTLMKIAGMLAGPGVPDGTGPYGGTPQCPMTPVGDEEEVMETEEVMDADEGMQVAAALVTMAQELMDDEAPAEGAEWSANRIPADAPSEEGPEDVLQQIPSSDYKRKAVLEREQDGRYEVEIYHFDPETETWKPDAEWYFDDYEAAQQFYGKLVFDF